MTTSFEHALEECISIIESGDATIEECAARYPQHAAELRRLLAGVRALQTGRAVAPSAQFRANTRQQLLAHMRATPRRKPASAPLFMRWRLAIGMAAALVAILLVGTGAAQAALPGDALYGWKLASESVWRSVSPDPLATDLAILQRRANELLSVAGNPPRESIALDAYRAALDRLLTHPGATANDAVRRAIGGQADNLSAAGFIVPELTTLIGTPTTSPATLVPSSTALPAIAPPTILPTLAPSQILPTLPPVLPTVTIGSPSLSLTTTPPAPVASGAPSSPPTAITTLNPYGATTALPTEVVPIVSTSAPPVLPNTGAATSPPTSLLPTLPAP